MTALMPKRRLWMKWGLPYGVVLVAFVWAFHDEQPDYVIAFVLLVVFCLAVGTGRDMPTKMGKTHA